ncbi:MAG: Asp-tRNA(Asn)/Glu-tRNA(Gln) amidotransferase subunit GatA [Puniceicoccales bacterium]|jgi:aspartyl-tRNA(Asn)/glutamyl-tRNA(Gln) amidotransferase subunit A|nr:Asp-tRNA(Asn)/Glu-tRNA(Gln) amidotransferase subunit GatA [Puniceicoccales bacterium]
MKSQIHLLGAGELSRLLRERKISSEELTRAFIERTERTEEKIRAFISYDADYTLAQARASDQRRSEGKIQGPLDGIPVGIKDLIAEKDQPLTCGSRFMEHFRSPYDATVIQKLRDQGAVLWGRLNLDEFAMGSSTEHSAFQVTHNPWNPDCVPGGSSGGSAAAVAARQTPLALGSDTGGSIRQPAALCGVCGLKPTYGRVSRYGLSAFASSLDQIGPIGRTVEDTALLLRAIAGHDGHDSSSLREEVPDYPSALREKISPQRIGIPREYFAEGLEAEVRGAVESAIGFYRSRGHTIVELSLPHLDYAIPVYYVVATAEAASNLARFDGIRYTRRSAHRNAIDVYFRSRSEGFGPEVKRRIMLGTYVLSSGYYEAQYLRAQKVRTLIRQDFLEAFESVDFLLTPTSPSTAFKIGDRSTDPLAMYLSDIYTVSANLAGIPALSIPCGFSSRNLPIGLQLMGPFFSEKKLLQMAYAFESEHDFSSRQAPV